MSAPHALAAATLRLALCSVYRQLIGYLDDDLTTWAATMLPGSGDNLAVREIRRQFESVVDRVADELTLIHAGGLVNVDTDSYFEALRALVHAFDREALTLVASRDLEHRLPGDLHRMFLPAVEGVWDERDVAEEVRVHGRSALTFCCYALLTWTRLFPTERSAAAWGTLVTSTRMVEQSRTMLLEVRRAAVPGNDDVSRIVGTQRRDVSSALGKMELFGLPVENRFRRVPITVSYLAGRLTAQPDKPQPKGKQLDNLIIELATATSGRGLRLVIEGRAGSGKTTAVQWLAFTAAQQGLQSLGLPHNRPLLPLFVRLREAITSTRPPSDRTLLYSPQLQDEVAAEWLEECGRLVTPLILLDGWDEIAIDKVHAAEQWVTSLVSRFPHAHIVVTSRPEGLADATFRKLAFRHVTVLPLTPQESSELAQRWFKGLAEQLYASPDIDLADVHKAKRELLQDLKSPTISDMADSPLLTSMFCLLYATGNTSTPDKRGKLYDLVVSALLDLRERDRGHSTPEWKALDLASKEVLIGAVARAMAEHGTMSLPLRRDPARATPALTRIIAEVLPDLGHSSAEATKWTSVILDRSIVLQRVSSTDAEFIHRSVQDYLASKALRHDGDLPTLFGLAEAGQWSLLPFACHLADLDTADAIVRWTLDLLTTCGPDQQRAVRSVLVECLGAVTVLSRDLRSRAENDIASLFPPRDETEVKSLAGLGNAALPYLTADRTDDPAGRRFAIEALSRIGTTEAVDELARYARAAVATDTDALADALGRFAPETYVKRVLAESGRDLRITVHDEATLAALGQVPTVTDLVVDGVRLEEQALAQARHLPRLRHLTVRHCHQVGQLDWTAQIDGLRGISVSACAGLAPLTQVGPRGLWSLHLEDLAVQAPDWSTVVGDKPDLRVLSLTRISTGQRFETVDLSALRTLNTLAISGDIECESLDFLRHNPKITHVTLGYALSVQDVNHLRQCTGLRTLDVRFSGAENHAAGLASLASLTRLAVTAAPVSLLSSLGGADRLRELHLRNTDVELPLLLSLPPGVRRLRLTDCVARESYRDAHGLSAHRRLSGVEELVWRGGGLPDLSFLEGMSSLKRLDVEDDGGAITSLEGLDHVPHGCTVRLVGTRWGLDETPLHRLRERCEVIYEPDYDTDTFSTGFWVDYGGT